MHSAIASSVVNASTVSAVALSLSVVSAGIAIFVGRHSLRLQSVAVQYREFAELGNLRIEHPQVGYLLELPENYEAVITLARRHVGKLGIDEQYELLARERAVAVRVFSLYEETIYTRTAAGGGHDKKHFAFLGEVIAYFEGRLLLNPRLMHLWSSGGGNLRAHFEPETCRLYEAAMTDARRKQGLKPDQQGPFADDFPQWDAP